jgi:AcrR family transcriptional regulator
MIEIADAAEVSRATLYNHFRDKASVLRALLESEMERVFLAVDSDISPTEALSEISRQVSSDPALEMMRSTDPAILVQMLSQVEDPLWLQIKEGLNRLLNSERQSDLARLWFVGQVLQPLTTEQGREQATAIASQIL